MSLTVHSEKQFDLLCSEKSLHLFKESIPQNTLPSRSVHIWISIATVCHEPFSIIGRIISAAGNIFFILLIPLERGEKQKKEVFLYRICRLAFDPLSILSSITASAIRIFSSILGIGLPSLASQGWKRAELVQIFNLKLKSALWKQIAPNSPYALHMHEINPKNAIRYLGSKRCLKIEKTSKSAEEILIQENAVKDSLMEYLTYVSMWDASKLENALKINPKTHKRMRNILQKIQPSETLSNAIQKARNNLTVVEMDELFLHIKFKIMSNNALGAKNIFRNIVKNIKNAPAEYNEKVSNLEEKLSFALRFGQAHYPSI